MAGSPSSPGGRLSIGAVSRATGIPVETLRTWEQRYGFPTPERTSTGHRLYSVAIIGRLRRIAEALARGHRASHAVTASDEALARLIDTTTAPVAAASPPSPVEDDTLEPLLRAAAACDADALRRILLADWAALGPLGFLDRRVGPFLNAVGRAWAHGTLDVRHEHFVTDRLDDLLRRLRAPFDEQATGPTVVLTTLPGEAHALGLVMASLLLATAGLRVVSLGSQTPIDEIEALATDLGARAVAISLSSATRGAASRRALTALRRRLPSRIQMVVGGDGAPSSLEGVLTLGGFGDLLAWAQQIRTT
jgi:methanogenic corrinoid protein MtbC1